jgi:hypothetical protein
MGISPVGGLTRPMHDAIPHTNAMIAPAAAIAKSKLAALDIVNADVNAAAAIAQSKLTLDIHQSAMAEGTANATTTSGSYVDVPDMAVNMTTGNNPVLIIGSITGRNNNANSMNSVVVDIDGADEKATMGGGSQTETYNTLTQVVLKTLTAAAHTIKLQWMTNTNTFYNLVTTNPELYHRRLTVIELKV